LISHIPYRPLLLATLLLVCAGWTPGSTDDEIRRRQAELQVIRDQIREFEEKIKLQQSDERAALDLVDTYDRKATLVRRLVRRYRADEQLLQLKIDSTRGVMGALEQQLSFLKAHYANYVTTVYKSGRIRDLELLLTSSSVNQFLMRTEYLRRFTAQRKRDAESILSKKDELEEKQAEIEGQLSEERRLIAEKGAEEDRLVGLAEDRRQVISQIRKDRKQLQREIDRKVKAARDLENVINDLVEADRMRREREAEEARRAKLPQPPPAAGTFENKKGRLRWPVSQGIVVAHFGNQRHPTLKTVTQNLGIDIAVAAGSPVSSVADGEVARILWLPSYGNLMIINHYGGFRTVYTHLGEIVATEGQKLKEGDVIGYSGEALEGARLHFEIWKDREKQNPEHWLSRQ
jgi:septal ring factor EnvC (AmiA/AmiB activator)